MSEIGLDAFTDSGLESFVAPRALRIIRQSAFKNCKSLKHVQLNEGFEVLGTDDYQDDKNFDGVFDSSALERIALPSTLKKIKFGAFYNCENLKSI